MFHPLEETQDPENGNEDEDTQLKDLLYKEVVVETEAPASPSSSSQPNGNVLPSAILSSPKSPKSEDKKPPSPRLSPDPIVANNKTASIDAETIIKELEVEANKDSEKPAPVALVEPVKPVVETEPVPASPVVVDPPSSTLRQPRHSSDEEDDLVKLQSVVVDEEKPVDEQVSVPVSSEETLVSASQPESPSTEEPEVSDVAKPEVSDEEKPEISDEEKTEVSDVVAAPEVSEPEPDAVKLEVESGTSVVVDDSPLTEPEVVSTPALTVDDEETSPATVEVVSISVPAESEPETPAVVGEPETPEGLRSESPVEITQEEPKTSEVVVPRPDSTAEVTEEIEVVESSQAVEPSQQSVVVVTTTEEEVISPDGSSSTTTTITEVVTIVDDKASIEIPAESTTSEVVYVDEVVSEEVDVDEKVIPVSTPSTPEDVAAAPKTVETTPVVIVVEDNKEVTGDDKTDSVDVVVAPIATADNDVEDLDIPSLDSGNGSSLMDDITMELASSSP